MAKPSDELIKLARASAEAKRRALSGTYTKGTWEAWQKAIRHPAEGDDG
ncbi:hypothetical protein [Streptomyces sp. NPDC006971]